MTQEEFNQDRSLGFRPGVVVCIINPESKVLLGLKKEHQVWEIPQGGIETQDKTLAHAVKREISLHGQDSLRHIGVERLIEHGNGLRLHSIAHGRRRAHKGYCRGDRFGAN